MIIKNAYDNWGADSEIKAWKRVLDWLKVEHPNATKEIAEAEKNIFDGARSALEKAQADLSAYYSKITDKLQKTIG